jgi:hypothetical protein
MGWGFNSVLWVCKAGAVQLEPYLHSIFAQVVLKMMSCELFAQGGFELQFS